MSNFRVGQKVVCVDARWVDSPTPLEVGRVYTISTFAPAHRSSKGIFSRHAVPGLVLAELTNEESPFGAFAAPRFRPVAYPKQSLEHDIALFLDTPSHVRTSDKERA